MNNGVEAESVEPSGAVNAAGLNVSSLFLGAGESPVHQSGAIAGWAV